MRAVLARHALSAAALGLLAGGAAAAEPAAGTLTDTSGPVEYTAGPFLVPNPTPDLGIAGQEPTCEPSLTNCDVFTLTVTLPDDYAEAHPDDTLLIRVGWAQIAADPVGLPDFDLYVYDESGKLVGEGDNTDPEQVRLPARGGTHTYEIRTMTYMPLGESIAGSIVLDKLEAQSSRGALAAGGFGGAGLLGLALAALARRRR